MGDRNTESKEEASGDEHLQVDRDGLKNHTKDHDETADHDAPSSAQAVCDVGSHGKSNERADRHDASEKTEQRALGMSKVYQWSVETYQRLVGCTHSLASISTIADR
jgi:hypothetical protein